MSITVKGIARWMLCLLLLVLVTLPYAVPGASGACIASATAESNDIAPLEDGMALSAKPLNTDDDTGSISGFLWIDGNGSLPTDWNGLYDDGECPLMGFTVLLYMAHDPGSPVDRAQTGSDGIYLFSHLEDGMYIVGLAPGFVGSTEYLPPMNFTDESSFSLNLDTDPLMAFSNVIEIIDGADVKSINAGMRLPMGSARALGLLSDLWSAPLNSKVLIDYYEWFVIKKKTVGSGENEMNCVLLVKVGSSNSNVAFGTSTTTNNYEGSLLQGRMTSFYSWQTTIQSIAVKPTLGSHSSTSAMSEPTAAMAGNQTKDIMFALSYADAYQWNGNKIAPLISILKDNYARQIYLRTSSTPNQVWGISPRGDTFDAGLHYMSSVDDVPGVWVSTSTTCDVIAHYIDTDGSPVGSPDFDTHPVVYGEDFSLASQNIPVIPGYEYVGWKIGVNGTLQNVNTAIFIANVKQNTDIYLIYRLLPVTTLEVSKIVSQAFADKTKDFLFTITFQDASLSPLPSGTVFQFEITGAGLATPLTGTLVLDQDGCDQFHLKHGQSILIQDVPSNGYIRIMEAFHSNYEASFTDSEDPSLSPVQGNDTTMLAMTESARVIGFTNKRTYVPPVGVHTGSTGITVLLPLFSLSAGVAYLFAARILPDRRKGSRH